MHYINLNLEVLLYSTGLNWISVNPTIITTGPLRPIEVQIKTVHFNFKTVEKPCYCTMVTLNNEERKVVKALLII